MLREKREAAQVAVSAMITRWPAAEKWRAISIAAQSRPPVKRIFRFSPILKRFLYLLWLYSRSSRPRCLRRRGGDERRLPVIVARDRVHPFDTDRRRDRALFHYRALVRVHEQLVIERLSYLAQEHSQPCSLRSHLTFCGHGFHDVVQASWVYGDLAAARSLEVKHIPGAPRDGQAARAGCPGDEVLP